jgi:hypothetical protein
MVAAMMIDIDQSPLGMNSRRQFLPNPIQAPTVQNYSYLDILDAGYWMLDTGCWILAPSII